MSEERKVGQDGFTLVEVMVAMLVLTAGILAMAASTGFVFARLKGAGARTERALVVQQVADSLRSVPFTTNLSDASNRRIGRYAVSWQVLPTSSAPLRRVRIIIDGPGLVSGSGAATNRVDTTYISLSR